MEEAGEAITEEEIEAEEIRRATAFFSPEALIMFPIAAVLDLVGIILVCFGLDDFWITDIIGILTIGLWTYFHSQTVKVTYRAAERLAKAVKWARRLRWLRPLLIVLEFIPYGGAAPCWVLLVYFELQS